MNGTVEVRFIRPTELQRMMDGGQVDLVDIRREDEFRSGHIPGARLVPLDSLGARTDELDRDRSTVIYCKSGRRCQRAVQVLEGHGWTMVYVLDGGYDSYRAMK